MWLKRHVFFIKYKCVFFASCIRFKKICTYVHAKRVVCIKGSKLKTKAPEKSARKSSRFLPSFRPFGAHARHFSRLSTPPLSLSLSTTLSFLPRSAASRGFFFLFPRSSFVKRRESCKQLACPPGNIPIKYVLSIVNRWSGVFHRRAVIQCGSINAKPLLWFIS